MVVVLDDEEVMGPPSSSSIIIPHQHSHEIFSFGASCDVTYKDDYRKDRQTRVGSTSTRFILAGSYARVSVNTLIAALLC